MIGMVLIHKAIKNCPRNMLQQVMKNAIVVAHGVGLHFVSNTSAKRLVRSRINAMHHVHLF